MKWTGQLGNWISKCFLPCDNHFNIHLDVYTKTERKKLCYAFGSWIHRAQGEV